MCALPQTSGTLTLMLTRRKKGRFLPTTCVLCDYLCSAHMIFLGPQHRSATEPDSWGPVRHALHTHLKCVTARAHNIASTKYCCVYTSVCFKKSTHAACWGQHNIILIEKAKSAPEQFSFRAMLVWTLSIDLGFKWPVRNPWQTNFSHELYILVKTLLNGRLERGQVFPSPRGENPAN